MKKTEPLYEEYLYEELTSDSIRNIKSLGIILVQARKFKAAIEGVTNPALIEKSFKVLRKLTDESFIVKDRIRATVNHLKNRKVKIGSIKNSAASIKSINSDIKKLENAYYAIKEVNEIISSVKTQLRITIENIRKQKEQEKKQKHINKNTHRYVTTQGIFKIIGKFLKSKLSKQHMNYINFYNSYVLLGMDFNAIAKGDKKTLGNIRVTKYRLEQFINKFIETGELQKYIKQYTDMNVIFKNKKINLTTNFGTGSHSERLFKKDVGLRDRFS